MEITTRKVPAIVKASCELRKKEKALWVEKLF